MMATKREVKYRIDAAEEDKEAAIAEKKRADEEVEAAKADQTEQVNKEVDAIKATQEKAWAQNKIEVKRIATNAKALAELNREQSQAKIDRNKELAKHEYKKASAYSIEAAKI